MAVYDFIAKDHSGRNFRGTLAGVTEQFVYSRLQNLGYVVLSITKIDAKEKPPFIIPRISLDDIVVFNKLFSTVISSGVPVIEALSALEDQIDNWSLKIVIRQVRIDVQSGVSLSDAFAAHPKVFPTLFVSMVRAGEISGDISDVMDRLSDYMEKDQEVRRSVASTFFYPKIVILVAGSAVTYLLRMIVPQFRHIFEKLGLTEKLPMVTKAVLAISGVIVNYGVHIAAVIAALLLVWLWMRSTQTGRALLDHAYMRLPYLGRVNGRIAMSRMVRAAGSMLTTGVPLLDALDISKNILDNKVIEQDVERVIENVELGGDISGPLRTSRHFPPIVIYMVGAGERSGRLAELLSKCADAMDKELKHILNKMLVVLQIGLLILIAAMVMAIALAMYLPIIEITMTAPSV